MEAGHIPLLVLALAVLVFGGTSLARRTGLPDPVVLVVVGLVAGLMPFAPSVELEPRLVFLVFLPPLLYRAAYLTGLRTFREHATAIALLALGLVGVTACLLALAASLVIPGLSFSEGLLLGALVAPTDPVAATSVFERLGAPRRVVDLVQSEGLLNDAVALVLYGLALTAVTQGPPSPGGLALSLLQIIGVGLGVGVAIAYASLPLQRRLEDVGLQLLLSLALPFAAYVLAEEGGGSGVLAVVTAGVLVAAFGRERPVVRLQVQAFWSLLDLILNAVLFSLLGLGIRAVLDDLPAVGAAALVGYGLLVLGVVVGVRIGWQFVVPPATYRVRRALGLAERRSSPYERLLIGWTGMRGAISLAAALSLPLDLESRSLLIYLTVVVVVGTLVLLGITLPGLVKRADLSEEEASDARQERETRVALAEVALARLDELERQGGVSTEDATPMRRVWEQAKRRAQDHRSSEPDLVDIRLDLAQRQHEELARRESQLPQELVRELRRELDLQRVRLGESAEQLPS